MVICFSNFCHVVNTLPNGDPHQNPLGGFEEEELERPDRGDRRSYFIIYRDKTMFYSIPNTGGRFLMIYNL